VRVIGTRWILELDTVLAGNSPWLKLKLVGEVAGRGGGGRCAEAERRRRRVGFRERCVWEWELIYSCARWLRP
jgi:hypothetical protein